MVWVPPTVSSRKQQPCIDRNTSEVVACSDADVTALSSLFGGGGSCVGSALHFGRIRLVCQVRELEAVDGWRWE